VSRVKKSAPTARKLPENWLRWPTLKLKDEELDTFAVQIAKEFLSHVSASGSPTCIKVGPGITTVMLKPATETSEATYRRMSLIGGEAMRATDVYLGNKDGLILKLRADPNIILGKPDAMDVEVSFEEFATKWEIGGVMGEQALNDFVSTLGLASDSVKEKYAEIQAKLEMERQIRETEKLRREVAAREEEYAGKNWGAW
jgi:hypothetical protein